MTMVRKSIAIVLAAALVWLGVANGLLVPTSIDGTSFGAATPGPLSHATQAKAGDENLAPSHHSHAATPAKGKVAEAAYPLTHAHKSQRDCAVACLETFSHKLLPQVVLAKAPERKPALASVTTVLAAPAIVTVTLGYWPVGPPVQLQPTRTGASRVLASHAPLRI